MTGVIEPAASGRAKCRGCGRRIAKGELRFGERLPNPYGDGDATSWFHLACGACRRPEPFAESTPTAVCSLPQAEFLGRAVTAGLAHPRLVRLASVQQASSGRARCRKCREAISKDRWRFVLQVWQDGRFDPIGFIHVECGPAYFEMADAEHLDERIQRLRPELGEDELDAVARLLRSESAGV